MKINLVILLTVIILVLFLRLLGTSAPVTQNSPQSPVPSATITPSSSPASTSGQLEETVLGLATEVTPTGQLANLELYESERLGFMAMTPRELAVRNDILTYVEASPSSIDNQASCSFMAVQSETRPVRAERNLDQEDLPLVVYRELDTTRAEAAAIASSYVIYDEEGTAQLQLDCTQAWQPSAAFYTVLRSLRFI